MSEETPHQRNLKRVHEIRGKLSPVSHLIWCVKSQYDDGLSDDIGAVGHKHIQDKMEENAELARTMLAMVLDILEEIE